MKKILCIFRRTSNIGQRMYTIKIQVTSNLLSECYAKVPMSTTRGFPWSLVELSLDLEQGQDRLLEEGWRCARQPRWQPRPLLTRPELGMWVGGGAGHPNQTHPGHPHTNRPSIRPKTPNHPLSSYSSLPLGYIESNSSSCGISPLASLCEG